MSGSDLGGFQPGLSFILVVLPQPSVLDYKDIKHKQPYNKDNFKNHN